MSAPSESERYSASVPLPERVAPEIPITCTPSVCFFGKANWPSSTVAKIDSLLRKSC